jgi:hypothetical protein
MVWKLWRWDVRQETMRETWTCNSITVGAPGGGCFSTRHNKIHDTPLTVHGRQRLQGCLPQLDEIYFTTAEKKILEIADALFRIS